MDLTDILAQLQQTKSAEEDTPADAAVASNKPEPSTESESDSFSPPISTVLATEGKSVLTILDHACKMERQAIKQYLDSHYFLESKFDYPKLAKELEKISIDEMKHLGQFSNRFVDLGGKTLSTEFTGSIRSGIEPAMIYTVNVKLEQETIKRYNEFYKFCLEQDDVVSAKLFERIIEQENEHWLRFQDIKYHIDELRSSYLSKQTVKDDDDEEDDD